MLRKIQHCMTKNAAPEEVVQRSKAPEALTMLNNVTVTEKEIIFPSNFKRMYMPFEEIVWAYRQVAESRVSLGCCGGVIEEFRVIVRNAEGQTAMITYDREDNAKQLLEMIRERCPDAAIGFTKENKERFGVQ